MEMRKMSKRRNLQSRRFLISLLVMCVLTVSSSVAQDTVKLSLSKAIEVALSDNPTIMISGKEIERQAEIKRETKGNLLPKLDATANYTRNIEKPVFGIMGQTMRVGYDNTVTGGAALTLPLFMPSIYKTLKLNDEQMRAAVEAARASKVTLVNEVKKAYYNILLAKQSLAVFLASEQNVRKYMEETKSKYEQGLSSEYDLITAQVQLSNLQPTILQTRNTIVAAKLLLKMYLYMPTDIEIDVDGTLDTFEQYVMNASPATDKDVSNNTDIKGLEMQQNILAKQLSVLKTQKMPTLSAFSNLNTNGMSNDFNFDWPVSVNAGLQLSVPIFAGNTRNSRQKQLKNNMEQMKLQRDYLEKSVDVQVQTAINNIQKAREQMAANMTTVEQAKKGYSISQTRYNSGVGTILELNNSELSLTQAQLNYSQAIYDYLSAEADYNKILGKEF